MKFLVTNDWHLSSRAPSTRLDNYQDELFELLDQIGRLAVKLHAHIVVPGDIFHTAGGVSWALFFRLLQWAKPIREAGLQILAVAGNHDLKFNRLDSLDDLPLGVLFKMGVFLNVAWRPSLVEDVIFFGVPFPDSFDPKAWDRVLEQCRPDGSRPPSVLLTHCFASPDGGDYFGEPVWKYSDFAKLPFDVFTFGHDHSDGGVVEVNGKFFINLGALSRGSIAYDDITRDVKVALVTIGGAGAPVVQQIRLNYRPAAELFDLNRKAEVDAEKQQIEQFVTTLDTQLGSLAGDLSVDDRLAQVAGLPDAVRARVLRYLDEVTT